MDDFSMIILSIVWSDAVDSWKVVRVIKDGNIQCLIRGQTTSIYHAPEGAWLELHRVDLACPQEGGCIVECFTACAIHNNENRGIPATDVGTCNDTHNTTDTKDNRK